MRTFNDASSVTRWKAHFSYADIDGADDTDMILGLYYGKEKHHDGTDRLATYTGWQAGLLYLDVAGEDSTAFSGGVFVGANYYIANNLYIGAEINYTLAVSEDDIAVAPDFFIDSLYREGPKSGFHLLSCNFFLSPSYSPDLQFARFFLSLLNAAFS